MENKLNKPNGRLQYLRENKGLTQATFGEQIGLKWYQVKDLESGKVRISPVIAKALRSAFGCNENWLLTGKEPMFVENSTVNIQEGHVAEAGRDFYIKDNEREYVNKLITILRCGNEGLKGSITAALNGAIEAENMAVKDKPPDTKHGPLGQ